MKRTLMKRVLIHKTSEQTSKQASERRLAHQRPAGTPRALWLSMSGALNRGLTPEEAQRARGQEREREAERKRKEEKLKAVGAA